MVTETKAVSQENVVRKPTIQDVYAAARACSKRIGVDCFVSIGFYACHGTLHREWTTLTIHRGPAIEYCSIPRAIAMFERDDIQITETDVEMPVVADITAGPESDLEVLLAQHVTAELTPIDPADGSHTRGAEITLNFDVVTIDITLCPEHESTLCFIVTDSVYGQRVKVYAREVNVERDVDRTLAVFELTAELVESGLGGPWTREGGRE